MTQLCLLDSESAAGHGRVRSEVYRGTDEAQAGDTSPSSHHGSGSSTPTMHDKDNQIDNNKG